MIQKNPDKGRLKHQVILGITGGIAAYKAAELARQLMKQGLDVRVVMTRNATEFISPLTFQAITGNRVITGMFTPLDTAGLNHTALADSASLLVVAPATANIIGKYASGIADDFLSTLLLAVDMPVLFAPAMNPRMYHHPATIQNISTLKSRGTLFVGPDEGDTACGHQGKGRMADPVEIAGHVTGLLGRDGIWSGKNVLITAGPTREMIDPVRFISNRSTGKMGQALAAAAVGEGATVTVVSGPVNIDYHPLARVISVISADEMTKAVSIHAPEADIIFMTAAVADWTPAEYRSEKWKKSGSSENQLDLVSTTDILHALGKAKPAGQILIGFAAETGDPTPEARRKMISKHLDYIVGNDVSQADSGFESDTNRGVLMAATGEIVTIPLLSKHAFAHRVISEIIVKTTD